jgi:hypothetical protein
MNETSFAYNLLPTACPGTPALRVLYWRDGQGLRLAKNLPHWPKMALQLGQSLVLRGRK